MADRVFNGAVCMTGTIKQLPVAEISDLTESVHKVIQNYCESSSNKGEVPTYPYIIGCIELVKSDLMAAWIENE